MRGFKWSDQHYYSSHFFERQVVDEDDRFLELPSHTAPRAERCLWLGVRLASVRRTPCLLTRLLLTPVLVETLHHLRHRLKRIR